MGNAGQAASKVTIHCMDVHWLRIPHEKVTLKNFPPVRLDYFYSKIFFHMLLYLIATVVRIQKNTNWRYLEYDYAGEK